MVIKHYLWNNRTTEKAVRLVGIRVARFVPRLFCLAVNMTNRLNLHLDESGSQDLSEGRYIVAVVLHDHSEDIDQVIERYERRLLSAGLPNVPFHGKDLLHGNVDYRTIRPGERKRLLTQFARFVRELPISFFTLRYDANPNARRLLQVADYICTVMRIAEDYDNGKQTKTHERFFGTRRNFSQSFKKQLYRKAFAD